MRSKYPNGLARRWTGGSHSPRACGCQDPGRVMRPVRIGCNALAAGCVFDRDEDHRSLVNSADAAGLLTNGYGGSRLRCRRSLLGQTTGGCEGRPGDREPGTAPVDDEVCRAARVGQANAGRVGVPGAEVTGVHAKPPPRSLPVQSPGRCGGRDAVGDPSTAWEAMLSAMSRSGWSVTGTWPMRTELGNRIRTLDSNALSSSIVLVFRPRDASSGVIDRRGFLAALRGSLPDAVRKPQQGLIAPVDLAQAAFGPGMAVFSSFSKVIEADGQPMTVRTALESDARHDAPRRGRSSPAEVAAQPNATGGPRRCDRYGVGPIAASLPNPPAPIAVNSWMSDTASQRAQQQRSSLLGAAPERRR
jgi:hypothetical protein